MFMPTEQREAILKALAEEGVVMAWNILGPSRYGAPEPIPCPRVVRFMKSLLSKKYVTEDVYWNRYCWTVTEDGVLFLQQCLYPKLDGTFHEQAGQTIEKGLPT